MASTEAQKRASVKYQKKTYKRIPFDVRFDEYDIIKAAAENAGQSVNGYIRKALFDRMETERVFDLDILKTQNAEEQNG